MALRPVFAASLVLAACINQPTGAAKVQETAQELNTNTRFGRLELATEKVAQKARADFLQKHAGWGGKVRIADAEMVGLRMKGEEDAEVSVRVAWYRPDEDELRMTVLRQQWHDFKGDWMMTDESRADGELGLLGEPVERRAPRPVEHVQFPTIRIGGGGSP
jgi:hypothetical protein